MHRHIAASKCRRPIRIAMHATAITRSAALIRCSAAAKAAVDRWVKNGSVVAFGSGELVNAAIAYVGSSLLAGRLEVHALRHAAQLAWCTACLA
jgi:hypothetical protein